MSFRSLMMVSVLSLLMGGCFSGKQAEDGGGNPGQKDDTTRLQDLNLGPESGKEAVRFNEQGVNPDSGFDATPRIDQRIFVDQLRPDKSPLCKNGAYMCKGKELTMCVNGLWKAQDCSAICKQKGLGTWTGCAYNTTQGHDFCQCTPECKANEYMCDGLNLKSCESGLWKSETCQAVCERSGFGKVSRCGYSTTSKADVCFCYVGENGDPCTENKHCKANYCSTYLGYCLKECFIDKDCTKNTMGDLNYCLPSQGGSYYCYPSCTTNEDCKKYNSTSSDTCEVGSYTTIDGKKISTISFCE